jgi:hypothetical protein
VAHTCNPTYSGGRDQEDCGSKPAGANSLSDPILKKNPPQEKDGMVEWLKVEALSSNPSTTQNLETLGRGGNLVSFSLSPPRLLPAPVVLGSKA